MAIFEEAVEIVLKHEGGYVNDPKDPGGETKYGISKRAFPMIDIKALTVENAKELYRVNYWNKINGDQLTNQMLAANIFDFAVNAGIVQSVKTIQRVLNIQADGICGKDTIAAINNFPNPKILNEQFAVKRFEYYKEIIQKNPGLSVFLKGWKARCSHFITEGII